MTIETGPAPAPGQPAPVTRDFYNADQELVKEIDPLGRVQTTTLDGLGRATQTTSFTGVTQDFGYDAFSDLVTTTGAAPGAQVDGSAGAAPAGHQAYDPPGTSSKNGNESSVWGAFRDTVRDNLDKTQTRLGVLGMIPGAGIVPDAINTVISLGRGNFKAAAFDAFAMIPVAGDAARAAKLAKAGKTANAVGDIARGANKAENAGQAGKAAIIGKSAAAAKAEKVADETAELATRLTPEQAAKFPGCFFAGTLTSTELGQMPIERVAAGDRAWAFDLRACRWELCAVLETYEVDYVGEAVELRVAGVRIESTYHHPYWVIIEGENLALRPRLEHIEDAWEPSAAVPGRWVDAGELMVGDVLLLRDGRRVPVEAIAIRDVATKVYNFQVAALHNYAVGWCGVLVHNNSMQPTPKSALDALPGKVGKTGPIKQVPDEAALKTLYGELTKGGKAVNPGTYKGVATQLPDGTIVRMRTASKSGGPTLDITMPDGTLYKVHVP